MKNMGHKNNTAALS